ncbi:MAG: MBL fold metallo-hydrolase [Coriobacteriia bacterium]|nr:MBL fold metallo-hydrolase [Coriobacteriia bacterium]
MSGPRVTEVLPGVWTAEVSLPEFAVRSVALLGRERMLVFDTLLHPGDMSAFAGLAGNREIVTVYSHADWDHIWGTAGLPQSGGEVVGHSACADRFRAEVPETLAARRAGEPGVWDDVELIAPTTLFGESLALDLDPWAVELHHVPGHTRDSIVGWVPAAGVLLGGDVVEQPWPLAGAGLPLDPWITALREWALRPELRVVIPSHGAIAGPDLLERNAAYLTALRDGDDYPIPGGTDPFYADHYAADLRRYREQPEVGTD